MNDAGTEATGNTRGTVGTTIIRHYYLAPNSQLAERLMRFCDTPRQGLSLVEARYYHGEFGEERLGAATVGLEAWARCFSAHDASSLETTPLAASIWRVGPRAIWRHTRRHTLFGRGSCLAAWCSYSRGRGRRVSERRSESRCASGRLGAWFRSPSIRRR